MNQTQKRLMPNNYHNHRVSEELYMAQNMTMVSRYSEALTTRE